MICKNCKKPLKEDWAICPYCNTKIEKESEDNKIKNDVKSDGLEKDKIENESVKKDERPEVTEESTGTSKRESEKLPIFVKWKEVVFTILTCGIYGIYMYYKISKRVDRLCEGDGQKNPNIIVLILLTLITCGIYGYYWIYKQAQRTYEVAPKYYCTCKSTGNSVLAWNTFGLFILIGPLVALFKLFNNINLLTERYNMGNVNEGFSFASIPKRKKAAPIIIVIGYYIVFIAMYLLIGTLFLAALVFTYTVSDDSSYDNTVALEKDYEEDSTDIIAENENETEDLRDKKAEVTEAPSSKKIEADTSEKKPTEESGYPERTGAVSQPLQNEPETLANEYIIPDSDSIFLSSEDIESLSDEEIALAVYEICARHGVKFDEPEIQQYFENQKWYEGNIELADFDENMLNQYEKENVEVLLDDLEYIFADSDKRIISYEEYTPLSSDELQLAINEIYARRGRKFTMQEYREYFESKSWYQGTIEASDFDDNVFNEYERLNIENFSAAMANKSPAQTSVSLSYEFSQDVENGLLYSNEYGQITDSAGNVIPEYGDITVTEQGGLLRYGEVMANHFAGAGGKIIFRIPDPVM